MSVGVEQTRIRENTMTNQEEPLDQQGQDQTEDDYKRFMPNYNTMYKTSAANMPYYSGYNSTQGYNSNQGYNTSPAMQGENSVLLEKLNYMIHLLEEQQDEKTNNVTEEVILYCFLGIFIIFIADSFVRVGKYVR